MKHLIIILTILFSGNCLAQDEAFRYQDDFEHFLVETRNALEFNVYNEVINGEDILNSKEKLCQYISFLLRTTHPKAEFTETNIVVSEDKTKKIWFAYTKIENALRKRNMMFIICKANAKVILFEMDR